MADLPITSLEEKTTPAVSGDLVVMIDSEDGNKVKIQEALQYKGPQGDTGPEGPQGPTGNDGIDGVDGRTILNGTVDPTDEGVDGDFYLNTDSNILFGPKTDGDWGNGISIIGPTGATGPTGNDGVDGIDGKTILNGTDDPTSSDGVEGDFYINTTDNTLFGPRVGDDWGTGISLIGPEGPTGPAGADGVDGVDGLSVNWKGDYDDATDYVINDAVSYNGSSYIAIQDTTGNAPTDTDFWGKLAEKGADGDGSGDMLKSDYDPDNIVGDAFDMGNMKESATKKIFSDTERTKLDGIEDGAEVNIQADYTETDDTIDSYIKNKPDLSVYQTTANLIDEDDMVSDDDTKYPTQQSVKAYADTKEPSITKNTAFNKDFGTTADTVLEGNTNVGIVGTKEVDETDLADTKMLAYDDGAGKLVYIDQPSGGGGGGIETVPIMGEQVAGTKIFEYNADSDKTVGNVKISLEVANTGADFIVKAYKNGTDLTKDITIADGGGTAVNDRYVASLDISETLADTDVFNLYINQVGSDIAGSDFLALINIS